MTFFDSRDTLIPTTANSQFFEFGVLVDLWGHGLVAIGFGAPSIEPFLGSGQGVKLSFRRPPIHRSLQIWSDECQGGGGGGCDDYQPCAILGSAAKAFRRLKGDSVLEKMLEIMNFRKCSLSPQGTCPLTGIRGLQGKERFPCPESAVPKSAVPLILHCSAPPSLTPPLCILRCTGLEILTSHHLSAAQLLNKQVWLHEGSRHPSPVAV